MSNCPSLKIEFQKALKLFFHCLLNIPAPLVFFFYFFSSQSIKYECMLCFYEHLIASLRASSASCDVSEGEEEEENLVQ